MLAFSSKQDAVQALVRQVKEASAEYQFISTLRGCAPYLTQPRSSNFHDPASGVIPGGCIQSGRIWYVLHKRTTLGDPHKWSGQRNAVGGLQNATMSFLSLQV